MEQTDVISMDVLNIDRFILTNKLPEVKSYFIVQKIENEIDEEGLFSEKIFGQIGTSERLSKLAFINLSEKVMHPFYYALFKKLLRSFDDILLGHTPFIMKDGKLIKATQKDLISNTNLFQDILNGKQVESKNIETISGYDLIINYFRPFVNYLIESKESTMTKGAAKKLLTIEKLSVDKVLIDKFLVLPAGYREINLIDFKQKGILNYPPINDMYLKLLFLSKNTTESASNFKRFSIQKELDEIHSYFLKDQLSGKRGILKGRSVKKPVAYGTRGVITSNPSKSLRKWNDETPNNIPVGCVGTPVTVMISQFYPFFVHHFRKLLKENETIKLFIQQMIMEKTKDNLVTIEEITDLFLDMIVKDHSIGFYKVNYLGTEMTILDVLRLIAVEIVGTPKNPKKFVSATRYPVTNMYSTQLLLPIPYLTDKYDTVNGVSVCSNIEMYSTDFKMNTSSLAYQGGDFDGDALVFIGIFSEDANKDIKENAWFRYRNNDISGDISSLLIGNEQMYALYELTK